MMLEEAWGEVLKVGVLLGLFNILTREWIRPRPDGSGLENKGVRMVLRSFTGKREQ